MPNARGQPGRRDRVRARSALSKASSNMAAVEASIASGSASAAAPPPVPRSKVQLSDAELLTRARRVSGRIDFPALSSPSALKNSWKAKGRANGFTTYARDRSDIQRRRQPQPPPHHHASVPEYEVLSVGELACSLEEVAFALRSSSDAHYNAAMSGIYKKEFIYGSIVHVVSGNQQERASGGGDERQVPFTQASVKTGTFVKSGMFTQNEQWCFLELFRRSAINRSFFVTCSSMHERELFAGKAQQGRIDHLHGLITGYWVEALPEGRSVRIVFYGQFTPDGGNGMTLEQQQQQQYDGDGGTYTTVATTKKRLMRFARAAGRLEEVIRRRRLGAQTLADRSAFDPKNSRCICCTKSLGLLTAKKRCYLCGYAVCDNCWSIQNMEASSGHITTLRVCRRCLEFVDNGDYSQVDPDTLGPARIVADQPEAAEPTPTARTASFSSASSTPAGRSRAPTSLSDLLQDALKDEYYASRKQSVMTVMQQLMEEEKAGDVRAKTKHSFTAVSKPPSVKSERSRTGEASASSKASATSTPKNEKLEELEKMIQGESVPLEECDHATASGRRTYAIKVSENASVAMEAPIPDDEQNRLDAIDKGNLLKMTDTAELDLICSLAAREMKCSTSVVTIVGQHEQVVLASNVEPMRQTNLPRNETFCQHTVMDTKPLIVPHPEADIRFQNIAARTQNDKDFRFYCGFPILGENNAVVGAFCCLDEQSHEMTQSQYTTMQKLAATASKVVQLKGQGAIAAVAGNTPTAA